MKTIVSLLTCVTLCSCGVFKDEYKYTTMHKLHHKQHVVFGHQYPDCGWCNRDKAEQAKSMIVENPLDFSNYIL